MDELHVGRGTTRGAMTVFPLWGATNGYRRYTMGGRDLDVTEVDGDPDVGTLMVGNIGDRPALVLEGQLFEGGWQHRMARHSMLIGVHQRIPVEVACVEQGRWGGTAGQNSRGRRATPYVRDSVRLGGDVQVEVWNRVAVHTRDVGVPSPDNRLSMSDLEWVRNTAPEGNPTGSLVHRLDRAQAERQAWSRVRPLPGQVGVLIGIGGQPYVAEVFDSPHRLRAQLPA
ncbi:MAG: ARPP-1 family domain-containing protein, partial [Nocardioidaceae bacterium]